MNQKNLITYGLLALGLYLLLGSKKDESSEDSVVVPPTGPEETSTPYEAPSGGVVMPG